jgi:hypothetical protein
MKTTITFFLSIATMLLFPSCLQMPAAMLQPGVEGNLTQIGGNIALITSNGTAHGLLRSDMRQSFRDGVKAGSGSIRDWLISRVLMAGIDSHDATTASDESLAKAQISADTEAAKIASAEKVTLEKMALEAAEVPTVPVP